MITPIFLRSRRNNHSVLTNRTISLEKTINVIFKDPFHPFKVFINSTYHPISLQNNIPLGPIPDFLQNRRVPEFWYMWLL